ncbi:uncharacterized protein LOC133884462 [Phragmites australis]|uniref:uncharacterized protein LOC133884462 n=1 Tax=Phragmites australis TaxID=29695 RepID=UPI002D783DDF|nr:uncharacterized protein LOC133884462 [Phragmites australis]
MPQPLSRHAGFFASLQRVEDRLASEHCQDSHKHHPPPQQPEPSPFSDTMTASPLLFLDPAPAVADRDSSDPALDFLTLTKQDQRTQEFREEDASDDDHDNGEDIARLMALLGLSPPRDDHGDHDSGGCDCSGADGFLAKVVGVVGPKCDREKRRLDAWIHHYHRRDGGGCREPARLAHLLLAKASCSWDGHDGAPIAFPATVNEFLDRDAPPRSTAEEN